MYQELKKKIVEPVRPSISKYSLGIETGKAYTQGQNAPRVREHFSDKGDRRCTVKATVLLLMIIHTQKATTHKYLGSIINPNRIYMRKKYLPVPNKKTTTKEQYNFCP